MGYPVTLNGRTYTLADFEGQNYVDGLPDAFEDFVTHAGNLYSTTSTTSNSIGTGSKTFTVESSKPYQVGTPLRITDSAAPSTNWIDAIVTAYSGTTLTVDAVAYAGSGTKTSWNINIGGGGTSYTGTLPVAQGGTGATTAAAARTNLDTYSKSEADSRFLNVSGEASDVSITGDLTVNTNTLFVDGTNSRVGIGTTSPQTSLHIQQPTATAILRLHRTGATNAADAALGQIEFYNADGSNDGPNVVAKITGSTHGSSGSGGNLRFFTHDGSEGGEGSDPIEVGRFEGSGHFLVGKTSTSGTAAGLSWISNEYLHIANTKTGIDDRGLLINRQSADGTLIEFRQANAQVGVIGTENSHLTIGKADTGIKFQGNEVIIPWNTDTNAVKDAAINLGASGNRFKDLYLSGGVYLGGDGSSNLLDDYEEGTWTGSVSTNGFTQTVSSIAGTYTKVGRLVNIHYLLTLSSAGYASGYSLWTGLPFTAASTSQVGGYYATGSISGNVIGSTHFVDGNSANMYLFESTSTTSSSTWQGSFSYYTA